MKILVVEDADVLREALASALSNAGHDTRTASDGVEALERLSEADFQLMFLDLQMPRKDGISVLEEMSQVLAGRPRPRVAVISAFGEEWLERAKAAGAEEVIPKPFSLRDILAVVERAPDGAV